MKSVLVTGATSGIGFSIAERFLAAKDFRVFIHGRSAKNNFSLCQKFPNRTQQIVADFSNAEGVEKCFAEIPKLDILINNAGIVFREKEISAKRFEKVLYINTITPFLCSEKAVSLGASSIVNIGSMRGFSEAATTPDYSASKAALHNLTASLARKYAPTTRVNAVAPGFVRTPLHTNPDRLLLEAEKTFLKRTGEPEEIAETVFFLAVTASFCTGTILRVDGGRGEERKI